MSGLEDIDKLEQDGGISENWIEAVKSLDEIIEELIHHKKITLEQKTVLEKLQKVNQVFPEPAEGIHIVLRIVLKTGDTEKSEMKYFFVMRTGEKLELISGGSIRSKDAGHDNYTKFRHTYSFDDSTYSDLNSIEFHNEIYDIKRWLNLGAEITVNDKTASQ